MNIPNISGNRFIRTLFFLFFINLSSPALSNEPPWGRETRHESAGSRSYCNQKVVFRLLPRGTEGKVRWEILEIQEETVFRVTVARPFQEGQPVFDETFQIGDPGIQEHELSLNPDEDYRYTVQVECNPADPSGNLAASGFIRNDRLFGNNTVVNFSGT